MKLACIYDWVAREDLAAYRVDSLEHDLLRGLLAEVMSIVRQWHDWDDPDQAQSYLSYLVHTIGEVRGEINARMEARRVRDLERRTVKAGAARDRRSAQA